MPRAKLTRSLIDGLAPAKPGSSYYAMDTKVPGFGIRVYSTQKVYVVRYKGKPYEIGDTRLKTLEEARSEARRRKIRIEEGQTPAIHSLFLEEARRILAPDLFGAVMEAAQERFVASGGVISEAQRLRGHTLGELATKMQEHYREHRRGEQGIRADSHRWNTKIVPRLGGPSRPLRDITQEDVEKMRNAYKDRPQEANKLVDLLHWGFKRVAKLRPPWIMEHEIPTSGVDRYPRFPRKRAFSEEELPRVWGALIAARRLQRFSPVSLDICELILLTGCRPGEPRPATVSWVELAADGSAGILRLPVAKGDRSGREQGRLIYLGRESVAVIQRRLHDIPPGEDRHLFPGRYPGQPINYGTVWLTFTKLFDMACIKGRVPYSFRHTYVSEGEDATVSIASMKDLVGHRKITTTDEHYRSAKTRRLLAAAQLMSSHLAAFAASGEELAAEIVARAIGQSPKSSPASNSAPAE
jgi:integrase